MRKDTLNIIARLASADTTCCTRLWRRSAIYTVVVSVNCLQFFVFNFVVFRLHFQFQLTSTDFQFIYLSLFILY